MINLLPDDTKKQIKAAHANSILIRLIICLVCAAIFLLVICFGTYYLINKTKQTPNNDNSSSAQSIYQSNKSKADVISASFDLVKNNLSQKVNYSTIITEIAANLPTGVIIDSLLLNEQSLNQPITLKLRAKSVDSATQIKTNFDKSTSMFSNFSAAPTEGNQTDVPGYPYLISATVSINRSAAQ